MRIGHGLATAEATDRPRTCHRGHRQATERPRPRTGHGQATDGPRTSHRQATEAWTGDRHVTEPWAGHRQVTDSHGHGQAMDSPRTSHGRATDKSHASRGMERGGGMENFLVKLWLWP
jgi:hypothetical protein